MLESCYKFNEGGDISAYLTYACKFHGVFPDPMS